VDLNTLPTTTKKGHMSSIMSFFSVTALIFLILLKSVPGHAASIHTTYDIRTLMAKPHPFYSNNHSPTKIQKISNIKKSKPLNPKIFQRIKKQDSGTTINVLKKKPSITTPNYSRQEFPEKDTFFGNIITQISTGILNHDEGPFSRNKESGADLHLEMRFFSPEFLEAIWSPSPHIGANINSSGNTSQFFTGISYEWDFWSRKAFAGFSLGAAVHTGNTEEDDPDRKDLGCRLLFRESINVGYHINSNHDISLLLDHISNAKICSTNEGLENFGVRYSYRF